jgi:hypothetical protein
MKLRLCKYVYNPNRFNDSYLTENRIYLEIDKTTFDCILNDNGSLFTFHFSSLFIDRFDRVE